MPFIAKWPGRIPAGTTSGLVCVQYDLFATLADLTGQKVNATDGFHSCPELLGKSAEQKKHEYLYFAYAEKGGQLAIRMGDWKGVKTDLKKNPKAPWQLFDLRSDPGETTDISAQHRDVLKKFDAIVRREHEDPGVERWRFVEEVIKATGQ